MKKKNKIYLTSGYFAKKKRRTDYFHNNWKKKVSSERKEFPIILANIQADTEDAADIKLLF